jgi:hypothetical protein
MIWLQTPPWGRWLLATLIVMVAAWFELRPAPTVDHPFAAEDIARGEPIGAANTRPRSVPAGILQPVPSGAIASRDIAAGAPILATDTTGTANVIPRGWWAISLEVPEIARVGDRVLVVVIDGGLVIEGVISSARGSDPFTTGTGAVAVPAAHAAAVAVASVEGRVAVMVSTG